MKTRNSHKLLALLLAVLMTVSLLPMSAMAAEGEITVYMSVSLQGELALGKNGKLIAGVPITLKGDAPTVDEAIAALHDAWYEGGAEAGYATSETPYGLFIDMAWGEAEDMCMFYINGSMPWDTADIATLSQGDSIDVTFYQTERSYASFDKPSATAAVGKTVELSLFVDTYDGDLIKTPLAGASVWVGADELSDSGLKTDSDGKVSLSFPAAGIYIVSAKSETSITAPVCVVTVGFQDIASHWARASIEYVTEKGYFEGKTGTAFAPQDTMTRAMLVTVLWRAAGEPEAAESAAFSDVSDGKYYSRAVSWASDNGIVNGYENGLFGVGDNVTREQLAAMLLRYTTWKNGAEPEISDLELSMFTDADEISGYARDAMSWAYVTGLITGRTDSMLAPGGTATRAEVATIMKRFDETAETGSLLIITAKSAAAWLYSAVAEPAVAEAGGAWSVVGLSASGLPVAKSWFDAYLANVKAALVSGGGVLHEKKYTEYSREIIGLTAMGVDAADVAGYDLTLPLADFDATIFQGVNGAFFALIALDSGDYPIPAGPENPATRERYVEYILSKQLADGGFALSGDRGDPDMTAMALRALANYTELDGVSAAVEKALSCLSAMQNADGGFTSWGNRNSQSCSQVILALTALGLDMEDSRLVKSGNTVLDGLLSYKSADGGFANIADGGSSVMATEQALMALTALLK